VDVYAKLLILFVVVVVVGTIAYAIGRVLYEGARDSTKRADALYDKKSVYRGLFDGREVVTFEANRGTLPADTVVEDAAQYGYSLTNRAVQGRSQHLVFTKRP
jgi:hypothetical protein